MSRLLAYQPEFTDNSWLDEYELHFGEWVKQIVDWVDLNLGWLLDAIIWPFQTLYRLLMNEADGATSIMSLPWYWVAIAFFIIGSITRNTRVGLMAAVLVSACGMLGPDYWSETTKTFGMVFVSVLICTIIGIPLGVLAGRVDAVWNAIRPVLDAMQVIHPFVYMLPFIFFWGTGEEAATMAIMVFALPPLVRLTNLGVRQVPEDVVEASRSYGASEFRVLTDVQLPLARPAIMTGLNQTLMMAITMLGIAAIMGAGGLGKLLLQAINTLNFAQATSGGLAFFFVAVVLDRISQREHDDGLGLFGRIREALQYRKDPEGLLAAQEARRVTAEAEAIVEEEAVEAERPAPVGGRERLGLLIAAAASLVAIISTFMTWGIDAGLASSWGRRADEIGLNGQSSAGIEATGGSIFGIVVLGLSIIALLCAIRPLLSLRGTGIARQLNRFQGIALFATVGIGILVLILHVSGAGFGPLDTIALIIVAALVVTMAIETFVLGSPRMGADGAVITSLGALGAAVGYYLLNPSVFVEQYSHGFGALLAVIATAVAVAGGLIALSSAPYTPRTPLKLDVKWPLIAGAIVGLLAVWASMVAPWVVDERLDSLMTPEITAEIERLEVEAGNDINKQLAAAQAITNLINSLQNQEAVTYDGFDGDGPALGWPTMAFAIAATLAAIVGAGLLGGSEQFRWRFGTIAAGAGLAALVIPASWIFSFTRSGEPRALTGNGAFFAMALSFIFFAIGRSIIGEFRRRKVYADHVRAIDIDTTVDESLEPLPERDAVLEELV